jgi:hypothetical protein
MGTTNELGNSVRRLFNFALQKGELGARVARLRLEIVSLQRNKEAAFARLGRSYHANPGDTLALEPLLRDVDRIAQEIRDRESVLAQLMQQNKVEVSALEAPKDVEPSKAIVLEPPDVTR